MKKPSTRFRRIIVAGLLSAALALAVYYTGDQDKKVAWSGTFTIDTNDTDSLTKERSLATNKTSSAFTIDTRDLDSVVRALALTTMKESSFFTIDTREADALVYATSLATSKYSGNFTIDTRSDGTTYTIWGNFTIDTRDPDSVAFPLSLKMAKTSGGFTIDTTEPPPEDSDNDGLHDVWERLYFSSVFNSGPNDDPDNDGLSNFTEFATGSNPLIPNAAPQVDFWVETDSNGSRLYLRYWRHILATRMVKFDIIMSDTFTNWIDRTQNWTETGEVFNGNGYRERITLIYPLTGVPPKSQFVRLKLSRLALP